MVDGFNALSQQVFGKALSEVDQAEIDKASLQYPYFSPLQFLRLIKSASGSEAYDAQYQKAILYYHDPISFGQFILPQPDVAFSESAVEQEVPQPEVAVETVQEPEIIVETVHEPVAGEESETTETELAPFKFEPVVLPNAAEEAGKEEMLFEPYHTVDYFASQGIKISSETIPDDKFGKQVKSFTDWLKTMKRLPLSGPAGEVISAVEKGVENLAEHSVEDAEVITESMAEVWRQQGNIEKAIELYSKLSLRYPSKSAYFAAKISNINHSA
jgi:hypothetical protein